MLEFVVGAAVFAAGCAFGWVARGKGDTRQPAVRRVVWNPARLLDPVTPEDQRSAGKGA